MFWFVFCILAVVASPTALFAQEYTIDDTFDGCDYGRLYPIEGGGILECQEYQYFYEYRPTVVASGNRVLMIGGNRVAATLHNGSVHVTKVASEFQCATYSYTYAYRPEVKIFVVEGRDPVVQIKGKSYRGKLFKSR